MSRRTVEGVAVDRAAKLAADAALLMRHGFTWDAMEVLEHCRAVIGEHAGPGVRLSARTAAGDHGGEAWSYRDPLEAFEPIAAGTPGGGAPRLGGPGSATGWGVPVTTALARAAGG